jgi:hypothetical protein
LKRVCNNSETAKLDFTGENRSDNRLVLICSGLWQRFSDRIREKSEVHGGEVHDGFSLKKTPRKIFQNFFKKPENPY